MKLTDAQQKIVTDNYKLIHHVLKKLPYVRGKYEDYEQVAALALCKAAFRFDANRGFKFSTYAVATIYGDISKYNFEFERSIIRMPLSTYNYNHAESIPVISLDYELEDGITAYEKAVGLTDIADEAIHNVLIKKVRSQYEGINKKVLELMLMDVKQTEIALTLDRSQAQVSRIEKSIKDNFKQFLLV